MTMRSTKRQREYFQLSVCLKVVALNTKVMSVDKVLAFYRKEMGKYGKVVTAPGVQHEFHHRDKDAEVTCDDRMALSTNTKNSSVGTENNQRILAIKPRGNGSELLSSMFAPGEVMTQTKQPRLATVRAAWDLQNIKKMARLAHLFNRSPRSFPTIVKSIQSCSASHHTDLSHKKRNARPFKSPLWELRLYSPA